MGLLKSLYPEQVNRRLASISEGAQQLFCKANGNAEVLRLLKEERYIAWKLAQYDQKEREAFLALRKKYLIYNGDSSKAPK